MKKQKRLYFFFFFIIIGITITSCYDEVIAEDAKSIKLNNLNYSYSYFRYNYNNTKYQKVYSIGLMVNASDEHPVYGNPDANLVINNDNYTGTAIIDVYELKTPEIPSERWKGTGEYYIIVGLLADFHVDYYISRRQVRIQEAVTEIGFAKNFIFIRRE
jgi:hypothetical protein